MTEEVQAIWVRIQKLGEKHLIPTFITNLRENYKPTYYMPDKDTMMVDNDVWYTKDVLEVLEDFEQLM
jgi:hypothetical protein